MSTTPQPDLEKRKEEEEKEITLRLHERSIYPPSIRDLCTDTIGAPVKRTKKCNCKNSKCLKLYCECFASKMYCDGCNCLCCSNLPENKDIVQAAITATLERNPKAFRKKIKYTPGTNAELAGRHSSGCHCKKSGCLKKYCECYQAGIQCGENCKCSGCKNHDGIKQPGFPFLTPSQQRKPEKIRPTSVPPQSMMRFKASQRMSIPSPTSLKSQFKITELISAAAEEEKIVSRGSFHSNRTKIQNHQPNKVSPIFVNYAPKHNSKPQTVFRCQSAPPIKTKQNPVILQELMGMMTNTVSMSPHGDGLALAPPTRSPHFTTTMIQKPSFSPIPRPVPVQANRLPQKTPQIDSQHPKIGQGSTAFKKPDRPF